MLSGLKHNFTTQHPMPLLEVKVQEHSRIVIEVPETENKKHIIACNSDNSTRIRFVYIFKLILIAKYKSQFLLPKDTEIERNVVETFYICIFFP